MNNFLPPSPQNGHFWVEFQNFVVENIYQLSSYIYSKEKIACPPKNQKKIFGEIVPMVRHCGGHQRAKIHQFQDANILK